MGKHKFNSNAGAGREVIPVLLLLALAVIIPSACVLWFMNQAVQNERLAVRQWLTEVYQEEMLNVREELNKKWEETLRELGFSKQENPGQRFARLVRENDVAGVLVFDKDGKLMYPQVALEPPPTVELPPQWQATETLEYEQGDPSQAAEKYAEIARNAKDVNLAGRAWQGQVRCLVKAGREDDAMDAFNEGIKERAYKTAMDADGRLIEPNMCQLINDVGVRRSYNGPKMSAEQNLLILGAAQELFNQTVLYSDPLIPAPQRRFLMHKSEEMKAKYAASQPKSFQPVIPTLAAEDLVAEYLESGTEFSSETRFSRTKIPDLWQARTANGQVLTLYTTKQLKARVQEVVKTHVRTKDICIEAKPADEAWREKAFMELAAGDAMPEWRLGLFFNGGDPFMTAGNRQRTIYLWTGALGVTAMGILVGLIGRYQLRQMKLARLKNDFVATVTHELKTPLASMRLLTDTLLEGRYRSESQVREYLELIGRENQRLSRLIDNFLTFSRMERNKRAFEFKPVAPAEVVSTAMTSVRERLTAEGFDVQTTVEPNLPKSWRTGTQW